MSETKLHIIKYAPPPSDLPIYKQANPAEVSFFGRTNYEAALEEKKFIFGIKRSDRKRHMYIVGKSGVGKSKLLELLIRQDIAFGHGVCVLDPNGDLISHILDFVPEERMRDVILVDPSDMSHVPAFNPFSGVREELRHQFAESLVEIMEKQFGENWSPNMEHVFRFTILALLEYPEAAMRGMAAMLTDRAYRREVVSHVRDTMVRQFWEHDFEAWAKKFEEAALAPLVNKLAQLSAHPMLRLIFSQRENRIVFEEIMREKKIFLMNCAKGTLGEGASRFLGSLCIMTIAQAGSTRSALPESQRPDFYLYADEFHHFITPTFMNMLAEGRKYGMAITLAHQYLNQLPHDVQAAVLGSVGAMVLFRVSADDAARFEKEMTPVFKAKDMINLGVQEFYIKMTIDGNTHDPFSAEALKILPPPHASFRKEITEESRSRYAIMAEEAKNKLMERGDENNQESHSESLDAPFA
ncbi:MAG: type IV secretion system DNA-binding domain-containing protein [bacterium]|nr:type IV secretion system DNA-binding domain-containing protein [bacterium]